MTESRLVMNIRVCARQRLSPGCSPVLQAARGYARPVAKKRKDIPSHLDDLPPTMLKKDYANLPIMNSVDDVVKRLLSLEMASQREKLKVKTQQLVEKVRRSPHDNGSFEVQGKLKREGYCWQMKLFCFCSAVPTPALAVCCRIQEDLLQESC
ncbi:hypothetical protein EK904_001726 [Melospiza melodia maxima]|nr:hypothetical protein EK904_001726 [Melospiza melodia maxima]